MCVGRGRAKPCPGETELLLSPAQSLHPNRAEHPAMDTAQALLHSPTERQKDQGTQNPTGGGKAQ